MRRLIPGILAFVAGCANAGAPPGGPEDHLPPQIVAISPDSGATNVNIRAVEFRFDEVVSDRPVGGATLLDQIFLISPRNGAAQVAWHRTRITVKPRNGFRPDMAYRVTLLPGLADLRSNVRRDTKTIVFATGATFPPFSIHGRVFDWAGQRPASGAYIEAISHPDTSVVYLTASDTGGQFDVGPLPAGTYLVRALIDLNNNRTVDRGEKWDSLTVPVTTASPAIELDAIERDSAPAFPDNFTLIDSVHLRVTFDKPLDPKLPLQPALVRVQRPDSAELQIVSVQWQTAFDEARQRQAADSVRRADTTRAQPPAAAPPSGIPIPGGPRAAPPPPKPQALPPDRGIVLTASPSTPFRPNTAYTITLRGFRNLVGNSNEIRRTFTTPKPAPPPLPRDSTTRPPPPAVPPTRPPPRHR